MAVEPIFYVKGTSLDPVRQVSGLPGDHSEMRTGGIPPEVTADASAISGSQITLQDATNSVIYPAYDNFSQNKAFTIILRFKGHAGLNLAAHEHGVIFIGQMQQLNPLAIVLRTTVPGSFNIYWEQATTGILVNHNTIGTGAFAANVWQDIALSSNGIDGGTFDVWVGGTKIEAIALTADSLWDANKFTTINFGQKFGSGIPLGPVDEVAIFDRYMNDIAGELPFADGSNGKLSDLVGAARIKLLKATPSVVLQAVDLRKDVVIGAVTGLLDCPAEADTRFNVKFDNDTKTGTSVMPTAAQVEKNVIFDNGTKGALDLDFAVQNEKQIAKVQVQVGDDQVAKVQVNDDPPPQVADVLVSEDQVVFVEQVDQSAQVVVNLG